MKLTKYEHACFTLETAGQVLVVDPGNFTKDFVVTDNIAVIVVTHEHADHFDPDTLMAIYDKNPNAVFVSLPGVVDKMPGHKSHAVLPGDKIEIGPFVLRFFGGKHALIHITLPLIDNLGVLINDAVYYPGDSFTLPNTPVDVLALPVGGPWLKMSETMDFLTAIKPLLVFPTHDAVLSNIGKALPDHLLPEIAKKVGAEYKRIDGLSITV
ncbi:MBL fold metallo-hydrolase [Candidatus Saccharibacteria bacterium]|nr:MBL fold metallo-hydrolase [Candidatus Saccharibacteria bacterium]